MYISAELVDNGETVKVWTRDENGTRGIRTFDAPYFFYVPDHESGTYKDIFGKGLKRLDFAKKFDFYNTRKQYRERGIPVFESDVRPEYKILVDKFSGSTTKAIPNITFFDIETDYDRRRGFFGTKDPYAPISSVAIYHWYNGKSIVVAVTPDNSPYEPIDKKYTLDDIPMELQEKAEIILVNNEKDLLLLLMDEMQNSDIISGWNSRFFDVPYIFFRLKKHFGEAVANHFFSFGGEAPKPDVELIHLDNGREEIALRLHGMVELDYMEVFKKFEYEERQSYSLDAISSEILPEMSKLSYDEEGSLFNLYRDNFIKFIEYNIRDTEILKGFEERLGYIRLAIDMSRSCSAKIQDALGTTKLSEMAIMQFCHNELDVRVPDTKDAEKPDEKFTGALVLLPKPGMYPWVGSVDIESLYPTAIRSINISPETIVGQFATNHLAFEEINKLSDVMLEMVFENGKTLVRKAKEWASILKHYKWSISGYGTVFDQNTEGFLPQILTSWFTERKKFKALRDEAEKKYKDTGDEKYKDEFDYYERFQYIKKIQLNSMYGALGNHYFKYFDTRLAESTTRTGRNILLHMVKKTAEVLDGEYVYPSKSTVYSDTDSCYFMTGANDVDGALEVATRVTDILNKSFQPFMRKAFFCNDGFDSLVRCEQEIIADNSIFAKKKMYICNMVVKDGKPCDKAKVMGFQLKKSSLPKDIAKMMIEKIRDFLKGKPWEEVGREIAEIRKRRKNADILTIAVQGNVNKVEHYTTEYENDPEGAKLSSTTAPSILWNMCIDRYDDKESFKIVSGMKIRMFRLKNRYMGKFNSIAVPTDLNKLPDWFIEEFLPLIDREAQMVRIIDKPVKSVVEMFGLEVPTFKRLAIEDVAIY